MTPHSPSRREFIHLTAAVSAGIALTGPISRVLAKAGVMASAGRANQPAAGVPAIHSTTPLIGDASAKLRISAIIGDGGNSLVAGDGSGGWALLIDTKNAPLGRLLKESAALGAGADFTKGERLVINTHHHADHTGGNWAFGGAGVTILSHQNAKPRVLAQTKNYLASAERTVKSLTDSDKPEGDKPQSPNPERKAALLFAREYLQTSASIPPEAWEPTKTISGEHNTIEFGGPLKIEAHHFGPGHTDNDLILRLPEHNIIHMGDLLFHNNWCVIDRSAGADTQNWMKILGEAINLCDAKTVVIPGHGELTNVEGLKGQIAFLDKARAIVGEAIKSNTKREDVLKLDPPEFATRGFKQMRERTLGAIYDELTDAPRVPAAPPAGK